MASLFGTDGVRGIVNESLTVELALAIGRAFGHSLRQAFPDLQSRHGRPAGSGEPETGASSLAGTVLIGRDTRASGSMLAGAVAAGLGAAGIDSCDIGVVPTPGLAWLARHYRALGAVMISASHNPPEYNGIKLFAGDGYKIPDAAEQTIEELVRTGDGALAAPLHVGRALPAGADATRPYLEYLQGAVAGPLAGMAIVLDCAHGATWRLAPALFTALGATVTVLHDEPDGININQGCGSTHPERLQEAVVARRADAGFAFDGDGDRCLAVDENGRLVDGDRMLAMFAADRAERGGLPGGGVAGTIVSNFGLELALQERGLRLLRAAVGDRNVLELMLAEGLVLGGEPSGHLIFLDAGQTTGDGMLTAVQVVNRMLRTNRPLSVLAGEMRPLPQRTNNVAAAHPREILERPGVRRAIDEAQRRLGTAGRIVVRPSGTEPVIRVMVEAADDDTMKAVLDFVTSVIEQEAGS